METKLFTEPRYHDAEFYRDIPMADHWNQPGHGERLRMTFTMIAQVLLRNPDISAVADWGCGNGALLAELARFFPSRHFWGYDLLPANVAHAKQHYGFDTAVAFKDFVEESDAKAGQMTILTEVLEHLIDPHGLLRRLKAEQDCRWIVASSPAFETPENAYPFHNWCWDQRGYIELFSGTDWHIYGGQEFAGAQILVARKPL